MKKKLLVIVSLLFLVLSFTKVNADTTPRDMKDSKTKVTIQGVDLYGIVEVDFNNKTRKGYIGDFELSFDEKSNTVIAKVKRSQINNLVQENDKNAYINIELNLDYHDFEEGQNYYTAYSIENDTKYCQMDKITAGGKNNAGSTKYLEMLSTAVEITGGSVYTATSPGYRALYKGNLLSTNGACLPISDFESDTETRMIYLVNPNYKFSIDEDVEANMGNMESIETSHESNNNSHENDIKINNFYEIVDANRKQQLALSMYDENGKPIEIAQDDLNVEIDESENADAITSSFEGDKAEDVQILSINYKKNFKGKAKIKSYVGKKFKDVSKFDVYYYNETTKKMEIVSDDTKVDKDGYVSFTVKHFSEYVIVSSENKVKEEKEDTTVAPLPENDENNTAVDNDIAKEEKQVDGELVKDNNMWLPLLGIGIALFIILIIAIVAIIKGKKKETPVETAPVEPVTEAVPEGATEAVESVEGNDLMAPPPPVEEVPTEETNNNE